MAASPESSSSSSSWWWWWWAAGGAVGVGLLGGAVYMWRRRGTEQQLSAAELFERAFPGGQRQPIEAIRSFWKTRRGINAVHLNFWLFVADQNNDGHLSKEEFINVLRVGSFMRHPSWEQDIRLMAFRAMDTDNDGIIDRPELIVGLSKLFSLLALRENPHVAVQALLPNPDDVLSDQEWVRSPLAARIINTRTIQPLVLEDMAATIRSYSHLRLEEKKNQQAVPNK